MEKLAAMKLTPAYVFDLDVLKTRICKIRETLGNRHGICFAMKANSFLVRPLLNLVDKLEVCSPGEFRICERLSVPVERVVLSGVNKEGGGNPAGGRALSGKGTYTIESVSHLQILNRCACRCGCKLRVLLRISSGNQFGVDPDAAGKIIRSRSAYPNLEFAGIQQYTGTQKKKSKKIAAELEELDMLLKRWQEEYGYEAEELEYGPGLFVPYFRNEEKKAGEDELKELAEMLERLNFRGKSLWKWGVI